MPFDALVTAHEDSATASHALSLVVRMPDGGLLSPPVRTGDRIIDALAAFGVPIRRDCEGVTCRARIGSTRTAHVKAADRVERGVHEAHGASNGTTRFLDDLVMSPDLDGLELELPWDALVPQTYWVAG